MDKHYLTPLFLPETIAVFAGRTDDPDSQIPQARALVNALTTQRFTGNLVFLDIHTTGTLADLAQTRADLAGGRVVKESAEAHLERIKQAA
jgi:acetyltransferase